MRRAIRNCAWRPREFEARPVGCAVARLRTLSAIAALADRRGYVTKSDDSIEHVRYIRGSNASPWWIGSAGGGS